VARHPSISSGSAARPDGHKIVVPDRTDISGGERDERCGSAGSSHEFNLQTVWFVDLNDSAEITASETVIGQVAIKHYAIEYAIRHLPASGYAVTNRGRYTKSSPRRTTQTVTMPAERPAGPTSVARIGVLLPIRCRCHGNGVMGEVLTAEIRFEAIPVGRGIAESEEERRLEPTDRMRR
jgi:hypothetical protein